MAYDRRLSQGEKIRLQAIIDRLEKIKDGPSHKTSDKERSKWKFELALANKELSEFLMLQTLRDVSL